MNELRGQRQMPTSLNQLKTTLAFRIYKVAPLDLVSSHELTMNWAETSEHVDQTRSLTAGAGGTGGPSNLWIMDGEPLARGGIYFSTSIKSLLSQSQPSRELF